MSTQLEEVLRLRPGARLRLTSVHSGNTWDGTFKQNFEGRMIYVEDDCDRESRLAHTLVGDHVHVEVVDESSCLDVQVVNGPPRGMTMHDRLGPEIAELTHENPVQSGPVNTVVAHPPYDPPDPDADRVSVRRDDLKWALEQIQSADTALTRLIEASQRRNQ